MVCEINGDVMSFLPPLTSYSRTSSRKDNTSDRDHVFEYFLSRKTRQGFLTTAHELLATRNLDVIQTGTLHREGPMRSSQDLYSFSC